MDGCYTDNAFCTKHNIIILILCIDGGVVEVMCEILN